MCNFKLYCYFREDTKNEEIHVLRKQLRENNKK